MSEQKEKSGSRRPPMTVQEARKHLGLSVVQVRNLCVRGLIKYSKALPKKWLLDRDDVETFVTRTS